MKIDISEDGIFILKKVFVPVVFETEDGQKLTVCMRDDGFEICPNGANLYYVEGGSVSLLGEERRRRIKTPKDRASTHPGFYIKEDILDEFGITENQLAGRLCIGDETLSSIIKGESQITEEIAKGLAEITDTTEQFWLNLQQLHNEYLHHIDGHPLGDGQCGICHDSNKDLIDKFVTAKLADEEDCRQGWVIDVSATGLFVIRGESGELYVCEGDPTIVDPQPERK